MKIQLKGFVRDIYVSDKDKDGKAKSHPVDYVSFVDKETGGDVKLSFDAGHGLTVGQDVVLDLIVKGRQFGQNIGYSVLQIVGAPKK